LSPARLFHKTSSLASPPFCIATRRADFTQIFHRSPLKGKGVYIFAEISRPNFSPPLPLSLLNAPRPPIFCVTEEYISPSYRDTPPPPRFPSIVTLFHSNLSRLAFPLAFPRTSGPESRHVFVFSPSLLRVENGWCVLVAVGEAPVQERFFFKLRISLCLSDLTWLEVWLRYLTSLPFSLLPYSDRPL